MCCSYSRFSQYCLIYCDDNCQKIFNEYVILKYCLLSLDRIPQCFHCTYGCHRSVWRWCPGRCSEGPGAPSSPASWPRCGTANSWLSVTPSRGQGAWLPGALGGGRRLRGWQSSAGHGDTHLQEQQPPSSERCLSRRQPGDAWNSSLHQWAGSDRVHVQVMLRSKERHITAQLLLLRSFQPKSSFQQQRGGRSYPSVFFPHLQRGAGICKTKKEEEEQDGGMCLHLFPPSAQRSVRMLWHSSCIFLSFLSRLAPASIHSCDIPANEMLATSVGTCSRLWWGKRVRESKRNREREREWGGREGGEGDAFGAGDSTITSHRATISTWLLCACLQIEERWITCMSVSAACCILSDWVLLCCSVIGDSREIVTVCGSNIFTFIFLIHLLFLFPKWRSCRGCETCTRQIPYS